MSLVSSCSCLCPIHWSQVLSQEWRCSWSSAVRQCTNYIWVFSKFITYQGVTYIRGLTVHCKTSADSRSVMHDDSDAIYRPVTSIHMSLYVVTFMLVYCHGLPKGAIKMWVDSDNMISEIPVLNHCSLVIRLTSYQAIDLDHHCLT